MKQKKQWWSWMKIINRFEQCISLINGRWLHRITSNNNMKMDELTFDSIFFLFRCRSVFLLFFLPVFVVVLSKPNLNVHSYCINLIRVLATRIQYVFIQSIFSFTFCQTTKPNYWLKQSAFYYNLHTNLGLSFVFGQTLWRWYLFCVWF